MIKLIATDMDGTLLNKDGVVSAENSKAIRTFQNNGGIFAVSTGRDYDMSVKPIQEAGIKCDFICASGAVVYGKDGEIKSEIFFEKKLCEEIVQIMNTYGAYVELFTNKGRISTVRKEFAEEYLKKEWMDTQVKGKIIASYEEAQKIAEQIMNQTTYDASLDELFRTGVKIYKICTAMINKEKLQLLKKECSFLKDIVVEASFAYNAEITIKGAQKGIAVSRFAETYGVYPEEIMVLGDSDNDRSMMKMDFGYTVAMDNATREIKSLAKYVTSSNNDDGVAKAIETFIFKNR